MKCLQSSVHDELDIQIEATADNIFLTVNQLSGLCVYLPQCAIRAADKDHNVADLERIRARLALLRLARDLLARHGKSTRQRRGGLDRELMDASDDPVNLRLGDRWGGSVGFLKKHKVDAAVV